MFLTRVVSRNLSCAIMGIFQSRCPEIANRRCCVPIVFFVCVFLWSTSWSNFAAAQPAKIAIVLPASGDVQYARTVSKRFNQMLNSIGFTAAVLEEASLSQAQLKPRRLVILPLNTVVTAQTGKLLKGFIAGGGKLFVTYSLADAVAPLLGLRQTDWLKEEAPGQFAAVRLNAPEIPDMPASIRQASWNITVAEPTTPRTKIIGYWHNAMAESTGLPALFVGEAGVFFSHIFLPDDIQTKTQLLAALLGHLVPEFRGTLAKRAIEAMTTVGHTEGLEALRVFVQQSGIPEAGQAFKTGEHYDGERAH